MGFLQQMQTEQFRQQVIRDIDAEKVSYSHQHDMGSVLIEAKSAKPVPARRKYHLSPLLL